MRIERRRVLAAAAALALVPRVAAQPLLDELATGVANDRADAVRQLLARGMDPDSVDANGDPMLCIAARNGSVNAVRALLDAKANPNVANRYGDSPLMLASLKGNLEIVRLLVGAKARLDPPGWTPLIYAATGGHDAIVDYLIDHGANLDAHSPNGTTALMMAIHEHHARTAQLLIDRGADVTSRNQDGASALSWAKVNNEDALMRELRRAGARD
ncbi:MAG TPA: ankyrin repeat domain-containing protein [Casimicrobiaceae bacterium]|nr:ankyrin repeat domain-containing protein [Casimicrobiaceae bacterium]